MTPDRWKQVKQVLDAALERPADERGALVDEACAGDAALRSEVESLLASHGQAGAFLESTAREAVLGSVARARPEAPAGTRIGPYRVLEEIGRGGMGAVYLAERDDQEYRKQVAIKLLRGDMDSASVVGRFRQERQILAELDHPNIARLLDGGTTDEGLPYFVMEHVEGVPIDAYCEAGKLSVDERLELFRAVCSAVGVAHRKLVVHRDLKPGNILVTAEGTPKLLDFGIAKLLIARPASEHTVTGTRVMTPEYASPEQWRGGPVTAASDIYSLGLILYRLLTGRGPYHPASGLPDEIGRAMCEDDPEPPSAAAPQARHRLAGDLDAIVLKALRKEPERRYGSAEELSEDIHRHLEGRPVTARKGRLAYRAGRLLRRNKAAAVTALTTAALAALVSALVYHWARATGFAGPTAAVRTAPKSLAVLPFRPLERGVADPYLALGMADAIITRLGHVHGVVVRPTGSILKYVDSAADPLAAGRELAVDELVEGRFQHVGDRIRVTVQLLDLRDGASLWADTFDQQFQDVFAIQDVMSERIARALVANLTREEQERLRRRYTADTEAYGLYLRGRYFWSMRTREGLEKAVEPFRRAVEKDPGYALAWGGLADCYVLFSDYSVAPSRDAFPKAIEAATKALSLDDSLAEPHIALAFAKYRYEWDWPAAEREFARGIELNPSYATGLHWYSEYLVMMGRWEEALAQLRRAQELDPLSLIINADEGWYLYLARRGDEAIAHLQKTLERRPDFAPTHFYLGEAYELAGRYDEAIAEFRRTRELGGAHGLLGLAHALALSGRTRQAREAMAELEKLAGPNPDGRHAIFYAALGERDRAFQALETAYREREDMIIYLKVHPFFDPLRSDPRFGELLHRVGFPP